LNIDIREEPMSALAEHGRVSIAFRVERVLEPALLDGGLGGIVLTERTVDRPYVKDYDAIDGEGPARWAHRFDVRNWGLLAAHADGARVGGAVLAFDTPGADMLDGRTDLAVLWDLRVAPGWRGRGVGRRLFEAAERWAAARGCRQLKVETQNVNAAACAFYARRGCTVGAIDRHAYPTLPDETQLLWYRELPTP
jgi:GNAT superfamily N-acetyltransferase